MQLIDNWKKAWRFWSVQLGVTGTAILAVLTALPETVLQVWSALPDVFKEAIPVNSLPWIGITVLILGVVARVIKQNELEDD